MMTAQEILWENKWVLVWRDRPTPLGPFTMTSNPFGDRFIEEGTLLVLIGECSEDEAVEYALKYGRTEQLKRMKMGIWTHFYKAVAE